MNDGPFNRPRNNRWNDLDGRRPESMSFPEWAEEQTRRSHNDHGHWLGGKQVVEGAEALLRESAGEPRMRDGDPGE